MVLLYCRNAGIELVKVNILVINFMINTCACVSISPLCNVINGRDTDICFC